MPDFDILAEAAAIAQKAQFAGIRQHELEGILQKTKIFGSAVSWERCRRRLTYSQHHSGILRAVAECRSHQCGVSRAELDLVLKIGIAYLMDLERGVLDLASAFELLTSPQCLFVIKGLGFRDEDITPDKVEKFLLQRGDWWV